MTGTLSLPLIKELVSGGIDYGSLVLVEFESQSCWHDFEFTLALQALRNGLKTDLHLFQHRPQHAKETLLRFGLDVDKLRSQDTLRIIDSYTVQIGVGTPEKTEGADKFKTASLKLSDWSTAAKQQLGQGIGESERKRLHIDDNLTVMTRYNRESEIIDYWRTSIIPLYKEREGLLVNALLTGVASDRFYTEFEALSDGIIECRSREEGGRIQHYVRVRAMHGKTVDTRWQSVRLLDNGQVNLDASRRRVSEIGIGGWLKGPK